MAEFATPYTVQTRAYSEDGFDSRGRPVEVWAGPVAQGVYGWYMPDSTEPAVAGANQVLIRVVLLAPEEFQVGEHDKVIVPGYGELDVLGMPQDYNNGPFGWRPGFVVNLGVARG